MDKQGKVGWISHEDFLKMKELGIDTPDEYFVYKNNNMDEEDIEKALLDSVKHVKPKGSHPTTIVIDNFYNDPDAVRDFALTRSYVPRGEHGAVGHRTLEHFHFEGVKELFENLLGSKMCEGKEEGEWDYQTNGVFQHCMAEDPFVIHADSQQWAALVYLTPNAPPECGTNTYRHKETGMESIKKQEEWEIFKGNFYDATPFEIVDKIGNKYNRCVLMDAQQIHAASQYFGDDIMNDRLFQIYFFSTEDKNE